MDQDFTDDRRFVPADARRQVRVLVEDSAESIQLAIVSTRGNALESVSLDQTQAYALIAALHEAHLEADKELILLLEEREANSNRRLREARARNPWLNGECKVEEVVEYLVTTPIKCSKDGTSPRVLFFPQVGAESPAPKEKS